MLMCKDIKKLLQVISLRSVKLQSGERISHDNSLCIILQQTYYDNPTEQDGNFDTFFFSIQSDPLLFTIHLLSLVSFIVAG